MRVCVREGACQERVGVKRGQRERVGHAEAKVFASLHLTGREGRGGGAAGPGGMWRWGVLLLSGV